MCFVKPAAFLAHRVCGGRGEGRDECKDWENRHYYNLLYLYSSDSQLSTFFEIIR